MRILEVLTYPHEVLRRSAAPIIDFADPRLQEQIADLVATMQFHPFCVGLAAPQIGYAIRLLVMDCGRARKPTADHHGLLVLCNPEIIAWSKMDVGREGCLSIPDFTGNVVRAIDIQVRFQDAQGQHETVTMTGFEARVLQHEMDHLDGRLFIDRVVSPKADLFPRKTYS